MSRRGADIPFELTPADLRLFSEFLYRQTGMTFGESKRYYIERRIADGLAASGSDSIGA